MSTISFSNLPLGTRFRYPGNKRIYTILTQFRKEDGPLQGTIAEWRPDMLNLVKVKFNPKKQHAGRWNGQNIFTHIPKQSGGDCPDMVEAID